MKKEIEITKEQVQMLRDNGLQVFEISHYKHGRGDKISKEKLRLIKKLLFPRKERKPIIIEASGARVRNFRIKIFTNKRNN